MKRLIVFALVFFVTTVQAQDPRIGLKPGVTDAGVAAKHMTLVSNTPRPEGFAPQTLVTLPPGMPAAVADLLWANSDLAFRGNHVFVGSFHGFQIFDISNPRAPKLVTKFVCPGGQGDLSVYRNLLFMSVEMPNGREDCQPGQLSMMPDTNRFQGVRIFDISDINNPKQVAQVQTCRGSHTHTLVPDSKDTETVYIYVSGTQMVRSPQELAGCSGLPPEKDPNTGYFRIEVIKVPVAAPQQAAIVNSPRIFADSAGNIAGLWKGGTHGEDTQTTATTNQCHDITAFPEIGLAGGACAGNGILLDISDPANPKRIAEVSDPNFAYWHSATFNNDGSKLIFTDEWGGGLAPHCRSTDRPTWGANALFELKNRKLTHASYYKLPVPQSELENCVAHNGNIVPVPGRDIMVQAWYQGGVSVFDFTDTKKPVEIAYFDRGSYDTKPGRVAGHWSSYWYNGNIYATEILRGLDVFELTPSEHLSQNEIDAAKLVKWDVLNAQTQPRATWPASFVVARAYLDQLRRTNAAPASLAAEIAAAEKLSGAARGGALNRIVASVHKLHGSASGANSDRLAALARTLEDLAK